MSNKNNYQVAYEGYATQPIRIMTGTSPLLPRQIIDEKEPQKIAVRKY